MPNITVPAAATGLPPPRQTSRRVFLAAGPTAVLCASLRQAVAKDVDPIFLLIERHKALYAESTALDEQFEKMRPSDPGYRELDRKTTKAMRRELDALSDVIYTVPATIPGLRAYLAHLAQIHRGCLVDVDILTIALDSLAQSA